MHSRTWKKEETEVCRALGGERRRGHFGDGARGTGKSDCVDTPGFSVEVKLNKKAGLPFIQEALDQAKAAAGELDLPVAVIRRPGDPKNRRVACIYFDDFVKHYGGSK